MTFRIIIAFFLSINIGLSQSYIQVPLEAKENNVKIINLKESGILLCQKTENDIIKFRKYDSNLLFEWEVKSPFGSKFIYLDDYFDGNFVYIAFESNSEKTLEIFKIAANIAVVNQISLPILPDFKLSHFKANPDVICLAGTIRKEPILLISNTGSKVPKFISLNGKNTNGIQSLDINKAGDIVMTFIRSDINKSEIIFRTYSADGKSKETLFIPAENQNEFLSSRYFELGSKAMILGNYGSLVFYKEELQNTQGMYITELGNKLKTRFYNLNTFKNAFNFLGEKEREKLAKQIKKRKSKGKEYKFSYRLAINELTLSGDKILVSGEMYQPIFSSRNTNTMPLNNYSYNPLMSRSFFYNPYFLYNTNSGNSRTTRYFEGYKFFSGMVMAIDSSASLVWDNSVPFKNIYSMDLKSHMKLNMLDTRHFLSYGTGQKFLLSQYNNDGTYNNTIDYSSSSKDFLTKIKKNDFENFEHWYGDFFLSWGVLNKIDKNANNNLVCLIQKITVD
jgi:hypothetical protein